MSEERLIGKRKRGSPVAQKLDVSKDCYINAAFRSTDLWEVYMFVHFDYVVICYDPYSATKNVKIKGPIALCDGFPCLYGTCFQEFGVTAALGIDADEAFIFSGSSCARLHIPNETKTGVVTVGPKHITEMFPCLLGVKFLESHVDAALESPVPESDEAYLFQGSEYALIHFLKPALIRTGLITEEFPCLANTMFASGTGAAFASHIPNQAFLFKDNFYVLIKFTPGQPNDSRIISGPEEILSNASLQWILAMFKLHSAHSVRMKSSFFLINYDPASPGMDLVVKGPYLLCDGFPSLYATSLDEYRILAAFGCHSANEAFYFIFGLRMRKDNL